MGLFQKKPDLISERARDLTRRIVDLEAQIEKLSSQHTRVEAHPRLRSTALPRGQVLHTHVPPERPAANLEEVAPADLGSTPETVTREHFNELGLRKFDLAGAWRRWTDHWRGPTPSNPKLVGYLAAGSVQGLRPLRYEKRVARNRFITLVVIVALAVWAILALFLPR